MNEIVQLLILFAVLVTVAFAVLKGGQFKRKLFIAVFVGVGIFLAWLFFVLFIHVENILVYYLSMYVTMAIVGLILPVIGGKIFKKVD